MCYLSKISALQEFPILRHSEAHVKGLEIDTGGCLHRLAVRYLPRSSDLRYKQD